MPGPRAHYPTAKLKSRRAEICGACDELPADCLSLRDDDLCPLDLALDALLVKLARLRS